MSLLLKIGNDSEYLLVVDFVVLFGGEELPANKSYWVEVPVVELREDPA